MNDPRVATALLLLLLLLAGTSLLAQEVENPSLVALGKGSIVRFSGREAISAPFEIEADIATGDAALNFASVIGQQLPLTLMPGWTVYGMIESIELTGTASDKAVYRVRLVPALARLGLTLNTTAFYNMSAQDVARAVLQRHGIAGEFKLSRPLHRREMLVQYRESDLAFISRLLEDEGIGYHFEHAPAGLKVVFSDSNAGFPVLARLAFSSTTTPSINSFSRGQAMHVGRVEVSDYDWQAPGQKVSAAAQATQFQNQAEHFYPSLIATRPDYQLQANDRLAVHVAGAQRCKGESTYPRLHAGHRFLLAGHFRADFNQEYVITRVEYGVTPKGYTASFECVPFNVRFRSDVAASRPVMTGTVTGRVIGPAGEQQHVDNFGRVRVELASLGMSAVPESGPGGWVRVAQLGAGNGLTGMWLPEIGDEVLVAFEHGDLNRPFVLGVLYNGNSQPPVGLPAAKQQALFRAQRPNGPVGGEIRFNTAPGAESLAISSDKRLTFEVDDLGEAIVLRAGKHFIRVSPGGLSASAPFATAPSPAPAQ